MIVKFSLVLNINILSICYILIIIMIPVITIFYTMSQSEEENKYAILNFIRFVISKKRYIFTPITKIEYIKSVVKDKIK